VWRPFIFHLGNSHIFRYEHRPTFWLICVIVRIFENDMLGGLGARFKHLLIGQRNGKTERI
jgi:hypothetical protein